MHYAYMIMHEWMNLHVSIWQPLIDKMPQQQHKHKTMISNYVMDQASILIDLNMIQIQIQLKKKKIIIIMIIVLSLDRLSLWISDGDC